MFPKTKWYEQTIIADMAKKHSFLNNFFFPFISKWFFVQNSTNLTIVFTPAVVRKRNQTISDIVEDGKWSSKLVDTFITRYLDLFQTQKVTTPHHNHFTIISQSYHNHITIISQSFRNHITIISQSFHNHITIISQSYHNHFTIISQLYTFHHTYIHKLKSNKLKSNKLKKQQINKKEEIKPLLRLGVVLRSS